MSNSDQPSRRSVLAESLALPIVAPAAGELVGMRRGVLSDPLLAKAAAWITQRQCLDALTLEWGLIETQLRDNARRLGVEMDAARGRRFPEVQAMRLLDRRIDAAYRNLADLAVAASLMRAVSLEGAVAKVELSVLVQGRYGWQDHALELAEGGIADLRQFTTR